MFGAKTQYWRKDKIEKYFISKDKIRNKIKELDEKRLLTLLTHHVRNENIVEYYQIEILEELLKESEEN